MMWRAVPGFSKRKSVKGGVGGGVLMAAAASRFGGGRGWLPAAVGRVFTKVTICQRCFLGQGGPGGHAIGQVALGDEPEDFARLGGLRGAAGEGGMLPCSEAVGTVADGAIFGVERFPSCHILITLVGVCHSGGGNRGVMKARVLRLDAGQDSDEKESGECKEDNEA